VKGRRLMPAASVTKIRVRSGSVGPKTRETRWYSSGLIERILRGSVIPKSPTTFILPRSREGGSDPAVEVCHGVGALLAVSRRARGAVLGTGGNPMSVRDPWARITNHERPTLNAAEQEIAADNRPSPLRSGGRLQLNFSRSADAAVHARQTLWYRFELGGE
jgi:hypothetical protein